MKKIFAIFICLFCAASSVFGQKKSATKPTSAPTQTTGVSRLASFAAREDSEKNSLALQVPFRCVGPTVMSGRVVDVDVDPADPTHFFVAYASGGLWETSNNGTSFEPIFDHEAAMTIGDFAVDWLHEQEIWIGTGEVNSSRSSYSGVGIYRGEVSLSYIEGYDTDKYIWENKGLAETHHIGRVIIHPEEPNTVWVAALGHLYTSSTERGIFKTTDGGITWNHVFNSSDLQLPVLASTQYVDVTMNSGAVDLVMDPTDPNQLFVSVWNRKRVAWNFEEGGDGSAIYQSEDGGESWKNITMRFKESNVKEGVSNMATGEIYEETGFPVGSNIGRIGLAMYNYNNGKYLYAFLDNQNKKVEEKKDENDGLKKEMFQTMSVDSFAQLDSKKLDSFLKENDFPEEHSAESLKKQVVEGIVKPGDLYDYLYEASAIFYEKPVIGAEVYRYDFETGKWSKTHSDPLDDVVFSYGYYFGLIRVAPYDSNKLYIAGVPLITSDDGGATWRGINPNNVHADHHALWINPENPKHLINGSDGGVQISYDDGLTWINCNSPAVGQFYTVAVDDAKPYNVYGGLQDNGVWVGPSNNEPNRDWYQSGKYPFDFLMGGDGMQVQVDTRDNQTIYTGYQFGQYARLNKRDGWESGIHPMHKLGEKPLRWNWQTPILLSKHHQDIFYICSNKVHRSLDKGDTFETLSADLTQGGKEGDVPYGTLTTISESPLQFGLLVVGSDDGLIHISKDNGYTWEKISSSLPQGLWVSRVIFSSHKKERIYITLNGYRHDHMEPYVFVTNDLGKTWKNIASNLPKEPVNVLREDPVDSQLLYVGTDNGLYVTLTGGADYMQLGNDLPNAPVHDLAIQTRDKDLVVGTHGRSIWIGEIEHLQQLNSVRDSLVALFPINNVNHSRGWGSNWSKWLEPNLPKFNIPFYSKEKNAVVTISISLGDSLTITTLAPSDVSKGLNYFEYDLSIDEATAKNLADALNKVLKEDEKEINIEKAGNGKYYLAKANYKVTLSCNNVKAEQNLVLE